MSGPDDIARILAGEHAGRASAPLRALARGGRTRHRRGRRVLLPALGRRDVGAAIRHGRSPPRQPRGHGVGDRQPAAHQPGGRRQRAVRDLVETVLVDDNDRVEEGPGARASRRRRSCRTRSSSRAPRSPPPQAQLQQMRATQAEARANLARLRQVAELSGGKVPSKAEMETAEATRARAPSRTRRARAPRSRRPRATLKSDETNLSKASIRSPIDGVVLSRKVEPGPDGRRLAAGAGALHARRGPRADGAAGRRRRGRRRAGARRPERHLQRRRLPESPLPRAHHARRLRLADSRRAWSPTRRCSRWTTTT